MQSHHFARVYNLFPIMVTNSGNMHKKKTRTLLQGFLHRHLALDSRIFGWVVDRYQRPPLKHSHWLGVRNIVFFHFYLGVVSVHVNVDYNSLKILKVSRGGTIVTTLGFD